MAPALSRTVENMANPSCSISTDVRNRSSLARSASRARLTSDTSRAAIMSPSSPGVTDSSNEPATPCSLKYGLSVLPGVPVSIDST